MTPSSDLPNDPVRGGTDADSESHPVPLGGTVSSGGPPKSLTANFPAGIFPGALLGPYCLKHELGRGGMGVVYDAEDEVLKRRVALKVMNPDTAADDEFRKRFLREGRAVAALKSDHVVSVYAAGEHAGVLYLAMEFIEGPTLEGWLKGRTVTTADVLWVARDLLAGLAAAHARGLIHRDVKPANLMVEPTTGRLKLLDFGLVRDLLPGEMGQATTVTVGVQGTPTYMSPEQARARKLDARTDLFSAGTVLYRVVVGRSPFARETTADTLCAVLTEPPPPLTAVPAPLSRFVERLMAMNPENRPKDADAARAELRDVEAEIAAQNASTDPDLPETVPYEPVVPERRVPKRALLALATVLLVVAVILLTRGKPTREGAQNPPGPEPAQPQQPAPAPKIEPRRPLPTAQVLRLIREDIDARPGPKEGDPKPLRLYLFAPHLASGSGLTEPERAAYRAALDAVAAHLKPGGQLLRPLDPDRTVFAVEPPSGFRAPDGLFVGYPYGLSFDQPDALRREDSFVRSHTGPVAYVRADWFVRYAVRRLLAGEAVYGTRESAPPAARDWAIGWDVRAVDIGIAADELGADRDQVKLAIRTHEPLGKAFRLGPLGEGNSVDRTVWESRENVVSGFQELARELGLGSPVLTE